MRREEVVKIIREEQEAEGGERRSKSNGIEGGGVTRKAKYPLNDRLKLPQLISRVLSLKCHLRERLVHAYKHKHTEELVALAGPGPLSRLSRLRNLLDLTWRYHRELWMGMYKVKYMSLFLPSLKSHFNLYIPRQSKSEYDD
jgi:hypothetical protein